MWGPIVGPHSIFFKYLFYLFIYGNWLFISLVCESSGDLYSMMCLRCRLGGRSEGFDWVEKMRRLVGAQLGWVL